MNSMLRRLLLLPVLAPLIAVAVLALLNPRPAVTLRLLTWTSPSLPVGSWLAIAVAGGGLLSAAATSAALQTPGTLRRQVRVSAAPGPERLRRNDNESRSIWPEPPAATAGPQRPPGAPPPTVEVPFRVIRKGNPSQPRTAHGGAAQATPAATPSPVASAVGDGWNDPVNNDW